jgi:hypothetical protein
MFDKGKGAFYLCHYNVLKNKRFPFKRNHEASISKGMKVFDLTSLGPLGFPNQKAEWSHADD